MVPTWTQNTVGITFLHVLLLYAFSYIFVKKKNSYVVGIDINIKSFDAIIEDLWNDLFNDCYAFYAKKFQGWIGGMHKTHKKEKAFLYEGVFMSSADKHQLTQAGQ